MTVSGGQEGAWGGTLTPDGLLAMVRPIPRAPPQMRFVQVPTWVHEERWVNIRPKRVPPKGSPAGETVKVPGKPENP